MIPKSDGNSNTTYQFRREVKYWNWRIDTNNKVIVKKKSNYLYLLQVVRLNYRFHNNIMHFITRLKSFFSNGMSVIMSQNAKLQLIKSPMTRISVNNLKIMDSFLSFLFYAVAAGQQRQPSFEEYRYSYSKNRYLQISGHEIPIRDIAIWHKKYQYSKYRYCIEQHYFMWKKYNFSKDRKGN